MPLEVECVADHVAFLHEGRIVASAPLTEIKQDYRLFTVQFPKPYERAPVFDGALSSEGTGNEWTFLCQGEAEIGRHAARQLGGSIVEEGEPSLEEIFVARVRGNRAKHAMSAKEA